MNLVFPVLSGKKELIPAVTHVDGTARVHTVSRNTNPLFWNLISEFEKISGVPVVLNTSFNENEPIVCTPGEALDCFMRTRMDALVLGPYWIERNKA
jgi:carbamoyltransferase